MAVGAVEVVVAAVAEAAAVAAKAAAVVAAAVTAVAEGATETTSHSVDKPAANCVSRAALRPASLVEMVKQRRRVAVSA